MKLSIIIPVYNEEKTVAHIIRKVQKVTLPVAEKEIIIVDDGSTDASAQIINTFRAKNIKILSLKQNHGKGFAVRSGLDSATGDYVIIQDADLEYDPNDINKLLQKLSKGKAQVIFGTRINRMPNFSRDEKTLLFFIHYVGNKILSLMTSALYLQWLTDMECCYKLFPREALKNISLHAKGFEFEPEITAKLLKNGYTIQEVDIMTMPRGYKDGKKLHTIRDGTKAIWTLFKYRFIR